MPGVDTVRIARRVEEASLNAWPALTQLVYDGWWLRLSRGFTKRANSVVPLGRGVLPIAKKLEFCASVYRRAGLDTMFRLASVHPLDDLDARLEADGWTLIDPTLVLACDAAGVPPRGQTPSSNAESRFVELDLDRWLAAYSRLSSLPAEAHPLHRALLNGIALPRVFGAIEHDGAIVAVGLGVVEDDLIGLFDVVTEESMRRRGHGLAVVSHLLDRGARLGARTGYLQVVEANDAARALYERLSFIELYLYWYRVAPALPATRG
jgi:ribosomal protein S18 acetylase RimI-like enzyme